MSTENISNENTEDTGGSDTGMSILEKTLRGQREAWREISERVAGISSRELPYDPPKRILLFGLGSSYFAAKLTAFALIRDKTRNRIPVIASSSLNVGVKVIPGRGDWVFGITHRGSPGPTTQALELCEKMGAFTIQVSAQDVQPLPSAKYFLATVPREQIEPHTAAVTGAICAITSLLLGSRAIEEWDALRSIGDPDVSVYRSRAGMGPTVLLGEWEGEWLAREGALKLMEVARLPVRVYATEEFFHGPHHAFSPENDRIWHISMPKDTRNTALQDQYKPAYSIGIFGASPLAWIPALVELQWLALAVALNRGVDPDLKVD